MIFANLEFELFHILIGISSIFIIYLAWQSTNVHEDSLSPAAVLLIENNRRRRIDEIIAPSLIIQEFPSSQQSNQSNTTEEIDLENVTSNQTSSTNNLLENFYLNGNGGAPSLQEVIDEVNDLAVNGGQILVASSSDNTLTSLEVVEEEEEEEEYDEDDDDADGEEEEEEHSFEDSRDFDQQQLIHDMDTQDTTEILRRRRLLFYTQDNNNNNRSEITNSIEQLENISNIVRPVRRANLNLQTGDSLAHADNCSNENNENENISKSEIIRNEHDTMNPPKMSAHSQGDNEFRVKLKFLNDDLRLVKGSPLEAIGDFKKRNFTGELASQNIVRLVFNGHILQPESKTLQACGLFDNCVVHCLVSKKPASANVPNNENNLNNNQHRLARSTPNLGGRNSTIRDFFDITTNGPLFLKLMAVALALVMIFSWYCRFQYSALFSLYSTIGLIILTGMFVFIVSSLILIERDVVIL